MSLLNSKERFPHNSASNPSCLFTTVRYLLISFRGLAPTLSTLRRLGQQSASVCGLHNDISSFAAGSPSHILYYYFGIYSLKSIPLLVPTSTVFREPTANASPTPAGKHLVSFKTNSIMQGSPLYERNVCSQGFIH